MRLDWSNIGKGLEAVAKAKMDRDRKQELASEAAKYDVTEGAYGTELQSNIQQVQGLKQQAIAGGMSPEMAAQQYDPSISELTRRAGLTQADYSLAQGPRDESGMPVNYATRQQAREEAAPLRAEGLSRVYRSRGDIEDADRLEARALDMRRGLQQSKLAEYQIGEAKRTADRATELEAARKAGETFLQNRARELGSDTQLTQADYDGALQSQIQYLQGKGFQTEANALRKDHFDTITKQIAGENAQYTQALGQVIASKDLAGFGKLYDQYVKDGAKVTSVTPNPDGSISVNRVLDNGGEVEPVTFKSFEELAASANSLTDPRYMAEFSQRQFDNNLRSAAAETQKSQFAERLGVEKAQLSLSQKRFSLDERQFAQAVKTAESKTLAGQIKELEGLGIVVSDDDKKALAGIKDGADPLLKTELEVIASIAKNDMTGVDKIAQLRQETAAAYTRAEVRKQTKQVVTGLKKAGADGKVPEALAQLRSIGMSEPAIQAAAARAGVPYVAPPVAGVVRNPNAGAGAVPPPVRRPMGTGGPQGLITNPLSIQP